MKLSVICPSINPNRWRLIYDQLVESVGPSHDFQIMFTGPTGRELIATEFTTGMGWKETRACPSVAFQSCIQHVSGEYIAFIPDDMSLDPCAFQQAIEFMEDKPKNHGMTLRYSEGGANQDQNPEYWRGKFHDDQKLEGIKEDWLLAPCFMYNREHFIELGGLDCSLEHVNLNGHSVAYVTQHRGGKMHLSPTRVFQAGWAPPTQQTVLYQAYLENDKPKFTEFWNKPNAADDYNVKFDNWKEQPQEWPRRYSQ